MLKSQVIPAFLSKTYAIMHNEEFKDIVCWGENGESILILKVTYFSLLSYSRWMIFQRKYFLTILNMVTFLLL